MRSSRAFVLLSLVTPLAVGGCRPRDYNQASPASHVVPTFFWPEMPEIPVCWENPHPAFQAGWDILRSALVEQYNGRTPVKFTGFGKCSPGMPGIHVYHDDGTPGAERARPAVVAGESRFGIQLSGVDNGVRMNFTFQNWHPDLCEKEPARSRCIRMYALHEFGHALGLGEEHLRSDNSCEHPEAVPAQGLPLQMYMVWGTQYDPKSVMNYCMSVKQIDTPAVLSDGDVEILRRLYGRRAPLGAGLSELVPAQDSELVFRMDPARPEVWEGLADGKDYLALGEPIHGSAVAHMAFAGLARDALARKGYRVLSLELPWSEMEELDRKLQSGPDLTAADVSSPLASLNSPFLFGLLKWMQIQNRNRPVSDRYHVAGFDTQQVVSDFQRLRRTWSALGLGSHAAFDDLVRVCHGAVGYASQHEFNSSGADVTRITRAQGDACRSALKQLGQRFAPERGRLTSEEWALVQLALESRAHEIPKWEEGISVTTNAERDLAMAKAFATLAQSRFSGKKQILWGHYWHMMKGTRKLGLKNISPVFSFMNQVDSFGSHMAARFGNRYAVVAGTAGSYTVPIQKLRTFTLESQNLTRPGTLSEFLHRQGRFFMLASVAGLKENPEALPIVSGRQTLVHGPNAGAAFKLEELVPGAVPEIELSSLEDHFDGILYLFHAL